MAITIEHILTKMEQQLVYARQATGEERRECLHKLQVLCELALEDSKSNTSSVEQSAFPKAVTGKEEMEIYYDEEDSLLDF